MWRAIVPRAALAAIAACAVATAAAHSDAVAPGADRFAGGVGAVAPGVEPWLAVLLAASAMLYIRGVVRLWRTRGAQRGLRVRDVVSFAAGFAVLCAALLPPLDPLAATAFRWHMVQHELLMIVAAPLLVAGRPLAAWAWGLPRAAAAAFGAAFRHRGFAQPWRLATAPLGAWVLHAAALWLWHAPALFGAALAERSLHDWQHVSFVATALLFWWSVLAAARRHPGAAIASLFATMLSTGALGALLTFSGTVVYAAYRNVVGPLTPLEDQQLGGLLMWIPGGLVYAGAALWIAADALRDDRRAERIDVAAPAGQREAGIPGRSA
jgi:putative membrane protein